MATTAEAISQNNPLLEAFLGHVMGYDGGRVLREAVDRWQMTFSPTTIHDDEWVINLEES